MESIFSFNLSLRIWDIGSEESGAHLVLKNVSELVDATYAQYADVYLCQSVCVAIQRDNVTSCWVLRAAGDLEHLDYL